VIFAINVTDKQYAHATETEARRIFQMQVFTHLANSSICL